jgi:hypothetical protein
VLRYAYFSDFNSGPKLLFWGAPDDMLRLHVELLNVAGGKYDGLFENREFALAVDGAAIEFKLSKRCSGLLAAGPGRFEWILDPECALEFADKVEVLITSGRGHQYLQCGYHPDEITVMVSRNEYPDDLTPG